MRLLFYQYVVLLAITAQIVSAAKQSAASPRVTRDAITDTAAASSIFTLRGDEGSESESISGILTRALKADNVETRSIINGTASYDEFLGVPRCGSVGTSCDTGNLIIGRGHIHPEPNYPNTLGTTCSDGTSGGPTDESVDRIIVSSEPGKYLMEEGTASITATVNCWAGGYTKDYVYFYYASNEAGDNADWNFIERLQCTGVGQQTFITSYTLPKGSSQAVRVSIRHMETDLTENEGSCGFGAFTDNDDIAFSVVTGPTISPSTSTTATPTPTKATTATPTPIPMEEAPKPIPTEEPTTTTTPTNVPSISPTNSPTPVPSPAPTNSPTRGQTLSPTESPFVLFSYGESLVPVPNLDIQISDGLTAKLIARAGRRVTFANGGQSSSVYHMYMDGAGITTLDDGGYVYVSNSEDDWELGGVHGLYFSKDGDITNYKTLLYGTTWNCGGGLSPWNTWISCEEHNRGQCWQIEPDPNKPNHNSPKVTLLGGSSGGNYDLFITEDRSNGELRRFEADGNGWDALHVGGRTTYLQFLDGNTFQWTTSLSAGQRSAANHYPNAEGIAYHDSTLYFVSKVTRRLYILNLTDKTYTSERTGSSWVGQGAFNSQPDQIIGNDMDKRKFIYFTEDGGNGPGVHVRDKDGKYYTMVRAIPGGKYRGDETVGLAFSPDRKKFFFGFQDAGVLMEVTRDDGQVFN